MNRVGQALLLVLPIACSSSERTYETQLLLSLSTDLEPDVELDYVTVEALANSGSKVFGEPLVLSVGESCRGDSGTFQLGTLGVAGGQSDLARLRVRGYTVDAGEHRVIVERRLDARFEAGRALGLEVFLGRECLERNCAEQTCNPASGRCEAVPVLADLEPASRLRDTHGCAVLAPDGPPTIGDEDGGTEMDSSTPAIEDREASLDAGTLGKPDSSETRPPDPEPLEDWDAADASDAGANDGGDADRDEMPASPVCIGPDGGCCDLGEHELMCSRCESACRDLNELVACGTSACIVECAPGYKDCITDRPGCETDVRTASNCGACGKLCVYDYCGTTGCDWKSIGNTSVEAARLLVEGEVNGFYLSLQQPMVRALGALVDPELRGDKIRIAIYEENEQGVARALVMQSDTLVTEDSPSSEVARGSGKLRVEWKTRRLLDLSKRYWIFVHASQSTRFAARNQTRQLITYNAPFADFAGSLPQYSYVQQTVPAIYAITTPE